MYRMSFDYTFQASILSFCQLERNAFCFVSRHTFLIHLLAHSRAYVDDSCGWIGSKLFYELGTQCAGLLFAGFSVLTDIELGNSFVGVPRESWLTQLGWDARRDSSVSADNVNFKARSSRCFFKQFSYFVAACFRWR